MFPLRSGRNSTKFAIAWSSSGLTPTVNKTTQRLDSGRAASQPNPVSSTASVHSSNACLVHARRSRRGAVPLHRVHATRPPPCAGRRTGLGRAAATAGHRRRRPGRPTAATGAGGRPPPPCSVPPDAGQMPCCSISARTGSDVMTSSRAGNSAYFDFGCARATRGLPGATTPRRASHDTASPIEMRSRCACARARAQAQAKMSPSSERVVRIAAIWHRRIKTAS